MPTSRSEWHASGESFRSGHPVVRVDDSHFAGSLFWLTGETSYELKVTLRDPDGVTGASSQITTLRTEADAWPEAALGVLHVSPTGVDSNTGASADAALRTIQRAADLANPGDVVLIHPGVYRETVRVRRSGTWIQPVVFRGVGSGAILDGSDASIDDSTNWRSSEYGIHALEMQFSTSHVSTERGRLFKYASLDDLRALRAGAPGGSLPIDALSTSSSPTAARRPTMRSTSAGWIVGSSSRTSHGWGSRASSCATSAGRMMAWGSCSVTARRAECAELASTRSAAPASGSKAESEPQSRTTRSGTRRLCRGPGTPSARAPRRTMASSSPARIRWGSSSGALASTAFDAIAPCGSRPPSTTLTTETDVRDNDLSELADDGIEAEPYCANLRIWNNRITGCPTRTSRHFGTLRARSAWDSPPRRSSSRRAAGTSRPVPAVRSSIAAFASPASTIDSRGARRTSALSNGRTSAEVKPVGRPPRADRFCAPRRHIAGEQAGRQR